MSLEIRRGGATGNGLECDLGEIVQGDPRPELGRCDRLMLTTRDYVDLLAAAGPRPSATCPDVTHDVIRAGDVWAARVHYRGMTWSWVLHPAHWWDGAGPPVYLGVWAGQPVLLGGTT